MPDASTKKLLVKLGISSTEWDTFVNSVQKKLQQMNADNIKATKQETAQTQAQIQAQKEKYKILNDEIKVYDKKIAQIQKTLDVQELDAKQRKDLLDKAKNILSVEEATVNLYKKKAEYQDVDLSKINQRLEKEKAELTLLERRFRLEQPAVKMPALAEMTAGRVQALQTSLQRAQVGTTVTQIQSEIRAQEELYRSGAMKQKQFIESQIPLVNELHRIKMTAIQQEKVAAEAAAAIRIKTEKVPAQQVALETNIIMEQLKKREILEKQSFEREMTRLQELQRQTGIMPRLTRAMEGGERGIGGILGGLTGMATAGMGGGVLGAVGGIAGQLVAGPEGALLGGLLGGQVTTALDSVIEKMKELSKVIEEATGKEAQMATEFEKLARGQDTDPEKFIARLRDASHGLADNAQLYQVANNFMRLGMKLTSDQITELTRVTVDLSRASGRTAEEGMGALIRASRTGRLQMLAFATGIPITEMRMRGLSSAISPLERQHLELARYMELARKQLEQLGTPLMTLPELLKIYRTAHEEVIHEFAIGIATSKGFGMALGQLAEIIRNTEEALLPIAKAIGSNLGQALYLIAPLIRLVSAGFHQFVTEIKLFGTFIEILVPGLRQVGGELKNFAEFVGLVATVFDEWTYKTNIQILRLQELAAVAEALSRLDFKKIGDIGKDFDAQRLAAYQEYKKNIAADLSMARTGGEEKATITPDDQNIVLQKQLQKLRLQIAQEEAKQRLEIMLEELDEEKQALKEHYEQGVLSLQDYITQQKGLLEQEKQDKVRELEEERNLRIAEIQKEAEDSHEPAELTQTKVAAQTEKTRLQILLLERQYNRQELALDNQLMQDKLRARRGYAAAVLELQKQGAEEQKKELEDQLTGGEIAPGDYLEKRKELIAEELALTEQGLQAEYDASEKNETAKMTLYTKTAEAEKKSQNELTDLEMKQNDIVLKAIEGKYGAVEKYLQASLRLGELQTATGGQGNTLGVLENMQEVVQQHIDALTADLRRMDEDGVQPISDDYIKVVTAITAAKEEQIKLNEEVVKMKDYLSPIADLMGQVESAFSHFPGVEPINLQGPISTIQAISRYTAQTGMSPLAGVRSGISQLFGRPAPTPRMTLSPIDQFKSTVSTTTPIVSSFSNALQGAIISIQTFSARLASPTGTATATTTFGPPDITKIPGAIPTVTGLPLSMPGLAGLLAGAAPPGGMEISPGTFSTTAWTRATAPGLAVPSQPDISGLHLDMTNKNLDALNIKLEETAGKRGNTGLKALTDSIGTVVGATSNLVQSIAGSKNVAGGLVGGGTSGAAFGSMFGPIGTAVGGTLGAISGAIVGSKTHAVNEQVKQLDRAFQNVVASLNNGSTKIGDAINQLLGLRQAAISQLGGSKKGQKQLQGVLQQFNQELISLQNQQKQILKDMFDQIKTLSQPQAMQPFVQQLSDIVKTYQQYLSAASGTPKFVERAHQYMTLALQNYIQTMNKDLRSAQEDAIQNALTLLDLEQQKSQMIGEERQQEYDIMTQGVLTRQRTIAQTKIGQIEQLRYQQALQLDQINQQIALAQYRVNAEQKIFGFTVDRISLEAQLLALKEKDANLNIAQINALESVIGKVQAALAGGVPWATLGLPGTTGTAGALAILQGAATPTTSPIKSGLTLETQLSQIYNLRGRYGSGGFYRENL